DVVWSLPIRSAAGEAAALVREGVSLARAFKEQRVFPPVLIHLTANGEASGQLAPMLERAAAELEREAGRRISWFAALLQPALIVMMGASVLMHPRLIVMMGAIVLVLVLAVMLPIVSMNQLIRSPLSALVRFCSCCASAQATCSRTSGEGSSRRAASAATIAAS